ncbi:unnamed protein product [Brassica rapa subsp. narinosa]
MAITTTKSAPFYQLTGNNRNISSFTSFTLSMNWTMGGKHLLRDQPSTNMISDTL